MDQNTQQVKIPQNDYTKMDGKTKDTIKASAIWSAVSSAITSIAGMLATYLFVTVYEAKYGGYIAGYLGQAYRPQVFNIEALVSAIIFGAIGGAIAGWVIAKFYPVFVGWQKKFVNNKLNTFFKILFYPYIVGFVISLVLGGALSMMFSGFGAFIITAAADVAAMYLYAKMMDKAVGKYYQQ